MFDSARGDTHPWPAQDPVSTESNDTLFNPGGVPTPAQARCRSRLLGLPHRFPTAGALLAAAGMPAHAIREVLGSRTYTGADG